MHASAVPICTCEGVGEKDLSGGSLSWKAFHGDLGKDCSGGKRVPCGVFRALRAKRAEGVAARLMRVSVV